MLVLPLYSFSSLSVKLLHASHSSFKHTIVLILKVEKTLDREIATENSLLQSSEVEKVAQFFFFRFYIHCSSFFLAIILTHK